MGNQVNRPRNFALIGAAGYIAPRHLEAIRSLGHNLVAAVDINDSVGVLDRYFPDARFFTDFERFESYLVSASDPVDFISICSPNHLHAAHIKASFRLGAHAICEKPLVLSIADLDDLQDAEIKYGRRLYTLLQLRVHDAIIALKRKVDSEPTFKHAIELEYVTSRGNWYHESWKGDPRKSGGLTSNIGVHFFDMLSWIFGPAQGMSIISRSAQTESGTLDLANAFVKWTLSVDRNLLPAEVKSQGKTAFRAMKIDGAQFEFSDGFTELHNRVYQDVLNGKGYGLAHARAAIEIVEKLRSMNPEDPV